MNCAIMNGIKPFVTESIDIRPTPATTFGTIPTGGATRPMALFMTNKTPN